MTGAPIREDMPPTVACAFANGMMAAADMVDLGTEEYVKILKETARLRGFDSSTLECVLAAVEACRKLHSERIEELAKKAYPNVKRLPRE